MIYRTITIRWLPRSTNDKQSYNSARHEAANLWNDMVLRHARIRRLGWKFPSWKRWQRWGKRRYPNLQAQSVQQIISEFDEAVRSCSALRKGGITFPVAKYPWKLSHFRDVAYTNQSARIRNRMLILPNGKAGKLTIPIPKTIELPEKLSEVRLCYGSIKLAFQIQDPQEAAALTTIGVDLGVNTLIAATDGNKAIVISGREAKATVQWRNKRLASLVSKQSRHKKWSRRHKRLQKRKQRLLTKTHHRILDITHKATRKVANAFPKAQVYVGKPFNSAAQKLGRIWAQQVSQASNGRIIQQLNYKTSGAIQVDEHYSSQTCPVCGCRNKCRRIYVCKQCAYTAPRDVVGAVNILRIGKYGSMRVDLQVPKQIIFTYPYKYPGISQIVPLEAGHVARKASNA